MVHWKRSAIDDRAHLVAMRSATTNSRELFLVAGGDTSTTRELASRAYFSCHSAACHSALRSQAEYRELQSNA